MSLLLETPVSCNYVGESYDTVVFLTLDRVKYNETVGRIYKRELHAAMVYFSQLPFAQNLAEHELILLAASAERYKIPKNTLICGQGEISNAIYFIQSGIVKIARKVCFLPRKMYYKRDDNTAIDQNTSRELFKVNPQELKFC